MILVNGRQIEFTQFPDGTTSFRFDPESENWFNESTAIVWKYDGDHECMLLWYLVHHTSNQYETRQRPWYQGGRMWSRLGTA